jgi:hypothetical protein
MTQPALARMAGSLERKRVGSGFEYAHLKMHIAPRRLAAIERGRAYCLPAWRGAVARSRASKAANATKPAKTANISWPVLRKIIRETHFNRYDRKASTAQSATGWLPPAAGPSPCRESFFAALVQFGPLGQLVPRDPCRESDSRD